ncbi:MAG: Arc family DNA-binding protein [Pedobacter sp.]|nr:MAG: Arc family DNA-binding protein [Pedobacter sp.]
MEKGEVRLSLRLPADVHAALVKQAEKQSRSVNGQIVHLLREATKEEQTTAKVEQNKNA